MLPEMQKHGQNRRPEEKQRLHDPNRKACLQHRTGLIQVLRQGIPCMCTVCPKRAQGDVDVRVAVPVAAVGVGDEAELVDGCDEGAEEEEVDEGDEDGGAFGCCVAD